MLRPMLRPILPLFLLLACAKTPAVADGVADTQTSNLSADSAVDAGDPFLGQPPAICRAGTQWKDQKAFTDVTSLAFSVDVTQVTGVRLSTADLDGDLLPDLVVRSMNLAGKRETWKPEQRNVWVLKNATTGADLKFSDITQKSGITATRDGADGRETHIVVFADVDNDGDNDAFCGNSVPYDAPGVTPTDLYKQDSSELMLNDGHAHFSLAKTQSFGTKDLRRSLSSASFVDYDRDGKLDLWLGYMTWTGGLPIQAQLVQGDGTGDFLSVTAQEGLTTKDWKKTADIEAGTVHRHVWGTSACDMDGDGEPDLLSVSYGRYFNSFWQGGFKADSSVRFTDYKSEAHLDRDDDDDWTTNWNAQCWCHDHPGDAECKKCGPPEVDCKQLQFADGSYRWNHATDRKPYRLGGNTGLVTCVDIDRDGDLDLVEGTIVHPDVGPTADPTRIVRNDGGQIPQFTHLKAEKTGLRPLDRQNDVGDMTGAVLDFDNDGRLDVLIASSDYPGTHAQLFQQQPDGTFAEVPVELAIDQPHAHGVAVADYDRDGDLDVVLGHSRARCNLTPAECFKTEEVHVFRNDMPAGNYVQIQLQGTGGSNRSAVGARVWVKAGGVTQMAEVGGGYGHFGEQNELVLHFGLGAACAIEEIKVRWPDDKLTTETWTAVRANYLVRLTQGQSQPAYPLVKVP